METIPLPSLPVRPADSHKGDYGRILIIAGSETMIGAPALAALAALRCGAGLVRIAAPKEIIPAVLTLCPCATAFAWAGTKIKELLHFAEEHDAVAIGPGLGATASVKRLVLELLTRHDGPMVFDADALNTLGALEPSEWPRRRNWGNIVLTPHMGEYMRLMAAVMKRGADMGLPPQAIAEEGRHPEASPAPPAPSDAPAKPRSLVETDDAPSTADGVALDLPETSDAAPAVSADAGGASEPPDSKIENQKSKIENGPDRTSLAELLARATGTVVLLKGHRTVITDGMRFAINQTGNPAMATAGMGDVLTGIIAALIGQKLSPLDAAVLGAHVHGAAGDLARAAVGPQAVGMTAADAIERIPAALATCVSAT